MKKLTNEQLKIIELTVKKEPYIFDSIEPYQLEHVGSVEEVYSYREDAEYHHVIKVTLPNGEVTHVMYSRDYDSWSGMGDDIWGIREVELRPVTREEWVSVE